MNVGELIDLLSSLPDDMPVAIGSSRQGGFGSFHVEHVSIERRWTRPTRVRAECPECGDVHRHSSSREQVTSPRLVRLSTTINFVPVREDVDAPAVKLFGRWPRGVRTS